jgi:hypothetical protein
MAHCKEDPIFYFVVVDIYCSISGNNKFFLGLFKIGRLPGCVPLFFVFFCVGQPVLSQLCICICFLFFNIFLGGFFYFFHADFVLHNSLRSRKKTSRIYFLGIKTVQLTIKLSERMYTVSSASRYSKMKVNWKP